ncbi:MAG TPA: sensor domain-containing diguanylate cyclase [Bacillales bacterium]|nr:sensor domain-containing diguanylate cyclase [Bacillales bacterium]
MEHVIELFNSIVDRFGACDQAIFVLLGADGAILSSSGSLQQDLARYRSIDQYMDVEADEETCYMQLSLDEIVENGFVGAVYAKANGDEKKIRERLVEFRGMMRLSDANGKEQLRHDYLIDMLKAVHASSEVDVVLREMIRATAFLDSACRCKFYLSHDSGDLEGLPVEHFEFDHTDKDNSCSEAFISGEIQLETDDRCCPFIHVPLLGRQGSYGVMSIEMNRMNAGNETISDADFEWIRRFAAIGGSALENAKLHQQSQQYIADLKLINETSHQLNANHRLTDSIRYITSEIIRSFHAEQVGFITYGKRNAPLEGSTEFFFRKANRPFLDACLKKIAEAGDAIFIGDLRNESWTNQTAYRSFMGVPMVHKGIMEGIAVVLHGEPNQFTFDQHKLLESLIHHSTLAFSNSILHEKLRKMVITDHLTRLCTRVHFNERLENHLKADRLGCFLLLDIDNFKEINDTFGHQTGDDLLVQVADILRNNTRDVDVVARWGGEELALYLPDLDSGHGESVAERLLENIRRNTNPQVTTSCGMASWAADLQGQTTIQALFSRADRALYAAKAAGKNQFVSG